MQIAEPAAAYEFAGQTSATDDPGAQKVLAGHCWAMPPTQTEPAGQMLAVPLTQLLPDGHALHTQPPRRAEGLVT